MIKNIYNTTILKLTNKQINNGINEIQKNYRKVLKFKDRLICFVIKNN